MKPTTQALGVTKKVRVKSVNPTFVMEQFKVSIHQKRGNCKQPSLNQLTQPILYRHLNTTTI